MPATLSPETKQKLLGLMWKGEPPKELATAFGVSVQYIYQLLKKEPAPMKESGAKYWRDPACRGLPPRKTCAYCGKKLRRTSPPAHDAGLGYKGSDACSEECLYNWTHDFGDGPMPRGECWHCKEKCGWDDIFCSRKCEALEAKRYADRIGKELEEEYKDLI